MSSRLGVEGACSQCRALRETLTIEGYCSPGARMLGKEMLHLVLPPNTELLAGLSSTLDWAGLSLVSEFEHGSCHQSTIPTSPSGKEVTTEQHLTQRVLLQLPFSSRRHCAFAGRPGTSRWRQVGSGGVTLHEDLYSRIQLKSTVIVAQISS